MDDEKDLVDVYVRLFRMKHMDVCFVAGNGLDAIELFRRSPAKPDIVIMDNRMPVMNGLEAMRAIMSLGDGTKFIFLSADASAKDEAIGMGAVFLKKPASLKELMRSIDLLTGPGQGPDDGGSGGKGPGRFTAGM